MSIRTLIPAVSVLAFWVVPAQAQEAGQLVDEFERAMRYFHMFVDDANKSYDTAKYFQQAEEALSKLEKGHPNHEKLPDLKKRLAEARDKFAASQVALLKRQIEGPQRSFRSGEDRIAESRQRGGWEDVQVTLQKMAESCAEIEKMLEENKPVLESAPGKEFASQVWTWLEAGRKKMLEYGLVAEVLRLLYQQDAEVEGSLVNAIHFTNRSLDDGNPESAIASWDKAKRLMKRFREVSSKYASVPEAKEAIALYDSVAARVEKELKPLIAKQRTEPLLESGRSALKLLRKALEERNERGAINQYRLLEPRVQELKEEWTGIETVRVFLAEAEPVMEKARKEFGIRPESRGEDKDIPKLDVDYSAPAAVQKELQEINDQLKLIREEFGRAMKRLGDLNLERGSDGSTCDQICRDCEVSSGNILRHMEVVEKIVRRLAQLDPKHPAVETMKTAMPRMARKAAELKSFAAGKCEYAFRIERMVGRLEWIDHQRGKYEDGPMEAATACAEVIKLAKDADEHYEKACAAQPEGHDEADRVRKTIEEHRSEAAKKLAEVCVSEVKRISQEHSEKEDAEREAGPYVTMLRNSLPDAPENAELGKILGGAAASRAAADTDIQTRHQLLETRAADSASALKGKYETYRADRKPEAPSSWEVVDGLGAWKGKYVTFQHSRLGSGVSDWFDTSKGSVWYVKYAPELREPMAANMKKMDDWVRQMAAKVLASKGLPADQADRYVGAHYFENTEIVCEITGKAMYTPKIEIRDSGGNVIGTRNGVPYEVPEVTVRAVRSTRYVLVPGAGNSLDSIKLDGFMP